MAKVGEGNPYYYLPHRFTGELYKVFNHDKIYSIAEGLTEDNAKLIASALNAYHRLTKVELTALSMRHGKKK